MERPAGRHGLGPHLVGARIVVRRLVRGETGPSGGPAMTDLLGECLAWDDDGCLVLPSSGEPVRVPLADIVTGKPVPPRASVRARVPATVAQRHGFALFPDLHTEPVGDWVLRRSATAPNRRANSCLAFGPSGVDDDVDRVLAFYERPVVAVLVGSPEHERFEALGWGLESSDADTLFQVAGLAQVSRALRGRDRDDVAVEETPDGLLRASVPAVEEGAPAPTPPVVEEGALAPTPPVVEEGALAPVSKPPPEIASGLAATDDDWVGFRTLEVDPAHRRQGLGLALMAALVDRAAEGGATTAYLQVLADNVPAVALYERLGFRTHHRYRYLLAPGH